MVAHGAQITQYIQLSLSSAKIKKNN